MAPIPLGDTTRRTAGLLVTQDQQKRLVLILEINTKLNWMK